MRKKLERLKKLIKYNDFISVLKEWKQEFEKLCRSLDSETEIDHIYRACQVLEGGYGQILAQECFYCDGRDKSKVEKCALLMLISHAVMSEILIRGRKKEEILEEIDKFIEEVKI